MLDRDGWMLLWLQATPALAAVLVATVCVPGACALYLTWLGTAVHALRARYVP